MREGEEPSAVMREALLESGSSLILLGQDIGLAKSLADRYVTVGGVTAAYLDSMDRGVSDALLNPVFSAASGLAEAHGTRHPIIQGPMANVSDIPGFAAAIADEGALPFVAVGSLDGVQTRRLLKETGTEMKDRPWGVGVLGFLPGDLYGEQLNAVTETAPRFAIISGGNPGQAAQLESRGIATYLHVPSPRLLELFIEEGARKFVFEGRECGGHVGPLTSFTLWSAAVDILLNSGIKRMEDVHVLFAGGIHDRLSAAMVSVVAAPLVAAGIRVGVSMGTAYLFTDEAVRSGAVTEDWQQRGISCGETVLLESGPGMISRCISTSFTAEFNELKERLFKQGRSVDEVRMSLEDLCVGRLRLAAKGDTDSSNSDPDFGLFMFGEAAALHSETFSIGELHADVADRSTAVLASEAAAAAMSRIVNREARTVRSEDIAIVGISCFFPGASDVREYWRNIVAGRDMVTEVDPNRWDPEKYFAPDREAPDKAYCKTGGFLDPIQFDPLRYGIPPASMPFVETIQLMALEASRLAIEDAGYAVREFPRDRTSVAFAAGQLHDLGISYIFRTMLQHYLGMVEGGSREELVQSLYDILPKWTEDSFPGFLGNVISGRIANRLNLGGSNVVVDAACASSMAALDYSMRQLHDHDCDVALVGAADSSNHAVAYLSFSKTQALSENGRARPFDDAADGTVISEGVAVLVLKRLSDAERDGDRIYATIKAIGSSSDGRKRSLTAPDYEGQIRALTRTYEKAGIDPSSVELIEAHGTGTVVGDQVEIKALTEAFRSGNAAPQSCALGSVKSMIGHTKTAAGMAGIIKCALALKHRILPPTIGIEKPNSTVELSNSPFYLNTESRPWPVAEGEKRRASVSAFGFGGTNFHTLLEEYSDYRASSALDFNPREAEIFLISDGSRSAVAGRVQKLIGYLEKTTHIDFAQLAYSLFLENRPASEQDREKSCLLSVVASSVEDLAAKLKIAAKNLERSGGFTDPRGCYFTESLPEKIKTCFLFPGQGSQRVNMLRDLVLSFPEALSVLETADGQLRKSLAGKLSRYIYPIPVFSKENDMLRQAELNATEVAQPALGAVNLAAADILGAFGIKPDMAAGHSYGEYVALCAAGVISRKDLLAVSAFRGRLVKDAAEKTPGSMAAVNLDGGETADLIKRLNLDVLPVNFNAPDQTVIAGTSNEIDRAVSVLSSEDIGIRKIAVSAAFHTPMMRSVASKLSRRLAKLEFVPPSLPVYSNTAAEVYPQEPENIREMLANHITLPIRFRKQIEKIYEDGARCFIEVGPGRILSGLVDRILGDNEHVSLTLDMPGRSGWLQLAHLLARGMISGLHVDLDRWFRDRRLENIGVSEVFERVYALEHPPKTIWRVGGARSIPWYEPVSRIRPEEQKNPRVQEPSDPFLEQIQRSSTEFFELQRQQLDISRRFLELQERTLEARLRAAGAPLSTAPPSGQIAPAGPPVPRLPRLPVRPSVNPADVADHESALRSTSDRAAAAETIGGTSEKETASTEEFRESLLTAVSDRTGYPKDMLDLDLNLEADLSIDSIKMVEIFSTLRKHHKLLQLREDDKAALEAISKLKTLRDIINWYDENRRNQLPADKAVSPDDPQIRELQEPAERDPVERFNVRAVPYPFDDNQPAVDLSGKTVLLIGRAPSLSSSLHGLLSGLGSNVCEIVPGSGMRRLSSGRYEADLTDPAAIHRLKELITADSGEVNGIVNLSEDVFGLFQLTKAFEEDLRGSDAGARLISFSSLGGRFGLIDGSNYNPRQAGCIGFIKSLAREWPEVHAKTIDVDPDMEPEILHSLLTRELTARDGRIEVGLTRDGRWTIDLEKSTGSSSRLEPLEDGSVILAIGGAYGITASSLKALVNGSRVHIVIFGRSSIPEEEPQETRSLLDTAELKSCLIQQLRTKNPDVTPTEVESTLGEILKNRQISETLSDLRKDGATVEYRSLDIRNGEEFGEAIDQIYEKWNRIDGVIHGAGTLRDRRISGKDFDSFETVFSTKVVPAMVLADKLRLDSLKFVVFFSSVVGRFGNAGQTDYSAANEVLNKLADKLDRDWPARVVSINWGPWDSGMVSDSIRELYAAQGIKLIPMEEGVRLFQEELNRGEKGSAEVVISRSVTRIADMRLS